MFKKNEIIKFGIIALGASTLAFGLFNVHAQNLITEGGVLGFILLLNHWFSISPAISGFIIDIICYGLGIYFLGKAFAKYSIFASFCFSVSYKIFEAMGPVMLPFKSKILAAVVGALFVGIGVGVCVLIGGACGGDDAIAMIISKLCKINIAFAYVFTDAVVLLLSLTYISPGKIVYSVITVVISSFVISLVQKFGQKYIKLLN